MKDHRFIFFMLVLFANIGMKAQYNPENPDEPTNPVPKYTLTLQATPQGGGSFNTNTSVSYEAGKVVSLQAYTATGFSFVAWKEGDIIVSESAQFSYTMPAHNVTLTAHYRYAPGNPDEPQEPNLPVYSVLSLSVSPSAGGCIDVKSGNRYVVGTTVILKAIANQYYKFREWTKDGEVVSTDATFNYIMEDGNPHLVANFVQDYNPQNPDEPNEPVIPVRPKPYHRLYLQTNPADGGYFSVESGSQFSEGTKIDLRAYSNPWYTFQRLTDGDSVVSTDANISYIMPDHDVTLTAHYTFDYNPGNPDEPNVETTGKLHIYGMTAKGIRAQRILYPVFLENPQAAGTMAFDVQFPEGFVVDAQKAVLAARTTNHKMDATDLGNNKYHFVIEGDAFMGDNGKVLDIPVTIPADAEKGYSYPVVLSAGMVDDTAVPVRSGYILVEQVNEDGLYARFTLDKLNSRVQFTNLSSDNARTFLWEFGDGASSTEQNPLHIYTEPGSFLAKLTVTGQTDIDVAEMPVLINDPATWRIEGIFYLDDTSAGVRYFSDITELFDFICASPLDGNITISLQRGKNYVYLLAEKQLEMITVLLQQLVQENCTLTLTSHGEGSIPSIDFRHISEVINSETIALFLELGKNMQLDDVQLELGGIDFSPVAYHQITGQTVASGERTVAENFKSISNGMTFSWMLITDDVPENVPTEGTGAIPAFSSENKTNQPLILTYHVVGSFGETKLLELDYMITVLPSVEGSNLALRNLTISKTAMEPGDELIVTWQVLNTGGRELTGGWKENVYLLNSEDTCLLATLFADDVPSLAAASMRQRSVRIAIPQQPGISGLGRIRVELIAANEAQEKQADNVAESQSLQLGKRLSLEFPLGRVTEGETNQLKAILRRSGSRKTAESFRVSVDGGNRVTCDQVVVIAKGQTSAPINVYIRNNNQIDSDSVFTFTVTGGDYPDLTALLTVVDDEHPPLEVHSSKTIITEGDTFQITVTLADPVNQETKVSFVSEHPLKFSYPQTAVLAVGERSVTINVVALDNDLPELDEASAFTIYVPGYEKGEVLVMLQDNDLPVLELTLTPNQVKEGDGPVSVYGTLRRKTNSNSKITVRLSDDSDGGLYLGQTDLVLAKGVNEAHFKLGPIDNIQVDGDRFYTVTAAVWLSSCSCSAAGQAAGSVSAQLKVYDDDGPTLTLVSGQSTVNEGGKALLTISRNTAVDTEQTVILSSDYDDLFTYDHIVVIPAGQQMQTVEVTAKENLVEKDSKTVVFTAKADGFGSGTCWLMVTDQTLPDACIENLTIDKAEGCVGESVTMTVEISNVGVIPLPDAMPVKIYRRGSATAVATRYTQLALAPGEETTVSLLVNLPMQVGTYAYYAILNDGGSIKELSSIGNTSAEVKVQVKSPYTATVFTDKKVYSQGETIAVSGQLEGERIANVETELYIVNGGTRQSFPLITDVDGHFIYEWHPYSQQSGHFLVGICYPGEGLSKEFTAVDIYGLRRQGSGYITCDVTEGEIFTGSITLENPGILNLTGLKAEVLEAPTGCDVKISLPKSIDGGASVQLQYTIIGHIPTAQNAWENIRIKVRTAEGVSLEQMLYYYCRSAKAQLEVSESYINTTMTKGKERDYVLYVTNIGRGNSGTVTLSLPEWIKSASGTTMASLAQNDTATVVLRLKPTNDMQLNVPVTGHFGINCANGDGKQIDYSITPVSEAAGTLTIDVCDENTYYTDDKPHVEGAEVVVRNPVTQALVAQGLTGGDGRYSLTLPEGYYQVRVTAANHDAYMNNIQVDPSTETLKTVNLSIRGIEVSYTVEETEEEDSYEIVNKVSYATNVPVPVVELKVPNRIEAKQLSAGESLIFNATLTNHGIIKAEDVALLLPTVFKHLFFEPLADYQGLTLVPGQTIIIPVKVTCSDIAESKQRRVKPIDDDPCVAQPGTLYYWDCGNDRKWHRYGVALQLGACNSNDPSTWNPVNNPNGPSISDADDWSGGWPLGMSVTTVPNIPGSQSYGYYGNSTQSERVFTYEDKGCEPCQNGLLIAALKCGANFLGDAKDTVKGILDLLFLNEKEKVVPEENDPFNKNSKIVEGTVEDFADRLEKSKMVEDQLITDIREAVANMQGIRGAVNCVGKGIEAIDNCVKLKDKRSFDDIYKCYFSLSGFVDMLYDDGLTDLLGKVVPENKMKKYKSVGKKLMKWKKYLDLTMECANGFVHACDHLKNEANTQGIDNGESNGSGRLQLKKKIDASIPSYYESYVKHLNYYVQSLKVYSSIDDIIWGPEEEWKEVSMLEMDLLSALDYSQSEDSLLKYKPDALSQSVFNDFLKRRKEYLINGWDKTTKLKLDSLANIMDNIDSLMNGISLVDCIKEEYPHIIELLQNTSKSVCASVKLQIPQTLTLTRQAFRGTLTVYNGHEDTAMKNVKLTLLVTNAANDSVATPREFQINAEKMTGFDGELDFSSGWTLTAKDTGRVEIKFIPTKYAAPKEPVKWAFGGVLSYVDPFTGLEVRRELYPVTLTVNPSPVLDLDYFMQRDIYGDDPLTTDVKEPMIPAEFALIINNKGEGDAKNVRMLTQQPQIVENEKGLSTSFWFTGSTLNGKSTNMNLGENIMNDFGTIPSDCQAWAQWWICDSLLGHFTEYDVSVNHLTSYGNPNLSLIDKTAVHELIHGFTLMDFDAKRGFLVNDLPDDEDLPDCIYFTDATQTQVNVAKEDEVFIQETTDSTCYILTVKGAQAGWVYGSLIAPVEGIWQIKSITRQSDNAVIPSDNVWLTDRTLRDGQDWLYENRLHFIAQIPMVGESYVLTFVPKTVDDSNPNGLMRTLGNGELNLRISPLPLGERISITGIFEIIRQIDIYDVNGIKRLSRSNMLPYESFYTGSLPVGIYYVRVITELGVYHAKVMKR